MIDVSNLNIKIGKRALVNNLTFTLSQSEIVALIGPNGCGKTTLCRALIRSPLFAGTLDGIIEIDGVSVSTLSGKELAKKISYMPQLLPVPDMSVFELCASARAPFLDGVFHRISDIDRKKVNEALFEMNIGHLLDKPVSRLSGGERQSVFFSMLLAKGSPYAILDEPTSSLDYRNKDRVFSSIRLLKEKGVGVLTVLHSLDDAVSLADRIILLDGGNGYIFDNPQDFAFSEYPERVFGVKAHSHDGNVYFK